MSTQLTTDVLADVPADSAKKLEGYAKAIDRANRKGVQAVLEMGRFLKLAHDELANHGNGTFTAWVEGRCGISQQTSANYMRVAAVFGGEVSQSLLETATVEALYFLSRDTTPRDAIDDAIASAGIGDRVTLAAAKEFVAKYTVDEHKCPDMNALVDSLYRNVDKLYEKWPRQHIDVMPYKLRALADEIEQRFKLEEQVE